VTDHVCLFRSCRQVTKERLESMQEKLSKAQLEKLGMEQKVRQDCMTHLVTIQLQCKAG
jgi:hypothetical protein